MQRLIKSLTGSPTSTSIQKSLTDVKNNLEKAKGNIQFTRQQPQFPNFESTAQSAAMIANETARIATTIQEYSNQQKQVHNISIPAAVFTQLQEIMNSAEGSRKQIADGIQAARAYTYPEAVLHYTEQVAGTLYVLAKIRVQIP